MGSSCRPIIILGVDRSGTSLVADLVHRWGAYAGELGQLGSPDAGNPQGYWEYQPMEDFLEELFYGAGVSCWNATFKQRIWQRAAIPEIKRRAQELVARMEAAGRPWFWKEPYLGFVLPFWERIWKRPIYVVPVRNPLESGRSYEKFILPAALSGKVSLTGLYLMRWQYVMVSILEHAAWNADAIFLSYEAILRSPHAQCEELCRFLDHACDMERDDGKVERMTAAVNQSLWRNRSGIALEQSPLATREQKDLYAFLLRRTTGTGEPFDASQYPLPPWGLEYLDNVEVFVSLFKDPKVAPVLSERLLA